METRPGGAVMGRDNLCLIDINLFGFSKGYERERIKLRDESKTLDK